MCISTKNLPTFTVFSFVSKFYWKKASLDKILSILLWNHTPLVVASIHWTKSLLGLRCYFGWREFKIPLQPEFKMKNEGSGFFFSTQETTKFYLDQQTRGDYRDAFSLSFQLMSQDIHTFSKLTCRKFDLLKFWWPVQYCSCTNQVNQILSRLIKW